MIIGIPKEIKADEYRVSIGAKPLINAMCRSRQNINKLYAFTIAIISHPSSCLASHSSVFCKHSTFLFG